MKKFLFVLGFLFSAINCRVVPIKSSPGDSDEVLSLPGYPQPFRTRIFSGFLDVSDTKHLHYVFVASENDPNTDPVVLWLNGGPGCSSLDGFFYEHGPFEVDPNNYSNLLDRPYRWNKLANVIYIEAPVGVGFSYSDNPTVDYHCNDNQTAHDNMIALEKFFEKFPSLINNPFFITGESYAGIYVPTLAEAIMEATENGTYKGAPLKGIAVGNGCSGNEIGICGSNSQAIYYTYKYLNGTAFISDTLKSQINNNCNWTDGQQGRPLSDTCNTLIGQAQDAIGHINIYNVYGDCVGDIFSSSTVTKNYKMTSKVPKASIPFSLSGPDACIDSRAASAYLNSTDVLKALHVNALSYPWAVCAHPDIWTYEKIRPNLPRDTYPQLIKKYRVLIYNGDWDSCVPFTDNEGWTEGMGLPIKTSWHAWNYTAADGATAQVGGYAVVYDVPDAQPDSSFTFTTVRGGRHEVPSTAPDKAFEMLTRLLQNQPF